jgi:hypothetical protein
MATNFSHLGGLSAYEVLGIEPTATTQEIEAAYRAAIKRQHSDTGGVTRIAQLVNDARDALVKDRASYDVWLRDQARPRVAEAAPDPGPAAPTSDSSRSTSAGTDDEADDVWDPWEAADSATPEPPPPAERQYAEEGPTEYPAGEPLSSGWVVAIVVGGMSLLALVSLAIAILLGVFSEPSATSSSANPTVMKQGQVVVQPGTKVVLDAEGTSFAPTDDHASLVGTESGLLFEDGTSYVTVAQQAPELYDTCSALDYPEPTDKPIPWNRLTIGSMLCVSTTYLETTKSLITVVDRSGRSATLKIITWND